MTVREVSNEFDIDRVKDIPWKKEVSDKNICTSLLSLVLFSSVQKRLTVPITYFSPKIRRASSHTPISVSAAMTPLSTLGAYT